MDGEQLAVYVTGMNNLFQSSLGLKCGGRGQGAVVVDKGDEVAVVPVGVLPSGVGLIGQSWAR